MKEKFTKNLLKILTVIGTGLVIAFIVYGLKIGIFTSQEALKSFLDKVGFWGPVVFIFLQIVQTIIPVIPGGVTCIVGVMVFGNVWGFIYNYVSIVIGSIIVFFISRKYGMPVLKKLFKQETIDKYIGWLDKGSKFEKLFAIAIFLPVSPDDFLCYLAGVTNISVKKYLAIIIGLKPFTILSYSVGLAYLSKYVIALF